jgi:hypothetical protein
MKIEIVSVNVGGPATRVVVLLGARGESDPKKAIDLIAVRAGLG